MLLYIHKKLKGGDKMTKRETDLLKKYIEMCKKLKTFPKTYIDKKEKEGLFA